MKKLAITLILSLLVAAWSIARGQQYPDEYLGLPGDNLNLYAVMKLFQESETLEEFERNLNAEDARINNLDLNGDNLVDYIMVFDYADGNLHTIVLRVALDRNDTQDVAVFTVERFGNGSVQLQLVGDEALYGRNYIIEPYYADNGSETPNPAYIGHAGNRSNVTVVRTTTYEIAAWPVVRFMFLPGYVSWRSSWYWGYYPTYWNPWRPYYWHYYYGYHYKWHPHYYQHYRTWNHHRCSGYNDFYYSRVRSYSPRVTVRVKEGSYRNTYSRPDLRRKGEALYSRTVSSQNARRNTTNVNSSRTIDSQSTRRRTVESTGSGTQRRSATGVNSRSATSPAVNQGTKSTRRATTTAPARTGTSNTVKKTTDTSRRSGTGVSTRSATSKETRVYQKTTTAPARTGTSSTVGKSSDRYRQSTPATPNRTVRSTPATQPKAASQRSSGTVSNRTTSKPQAAPKAVPSRSSSSQSRKAVSPSSSSSSSSRKTSGATKSSQTRKSATERSGRR
ncbi:hypothetical protein [Gaoshiqia sediminis]|uniref:Uncharacterized protein n=1 Tax=Gaoshiqia sediminis TaxID=2986998 RepID=A0AA41Y7G2_9BACT|nr:hypothetical protein [Gaoshiqia sediminis]MCW0484836.1 hypothetical protein [Gaoshiqia sediminis]